MSATAAYAATDIRPIHGAEAKGQTERLIRVAHAILAATPHKISHGKVVALVRRYGTDVDTTRWTFLEYFTNALKLTPAQRRAVLDTDNYRRISYVDATGEDAVANVMRGGR